MDFDFDAFLHFLKDEICHINKKQSPKNGKNGSFRTSKLSKIDFTLNQNDRRILKFPQCGIGSIRSPLRVNWEWYSLGPRGSIGATLGFVWVLLGSMGVH